MSDIPKYEDLIKMQSDPKNQTPLQREYNNIVESDERLTVVILTQMQQMISRNIKPDWAGFAATKTWMMLSMSLTPDNRQKYQDKWTEFYNKLIAMPTNGESHES